MIYRLTVSAEMMAKLNEAGSEEVRRKLSTILGLEYQELRRGRPRKGSPKTPGKHQDEKESTITAVPLPAEPAPGWKAKLEQRVAQIAAEKAARRATKEALRAAEEVYGDPNDML